MAYKISFSQLKSFINDRAAWAWSYALWLWSNKTWPWTQAWKLFHQWLHRERAINDDQIKLLDVILEQEKTKKYWKEISPEAYPIFEQLKTNYLWSNFKDMYQITFEDSELEFVFDYNSAKCVCIIDWVDRVKEDKPVIVDYKSVQNLTKVGDYGRTLTSELWAYWERELQAWMYMMWTWYDRVDFFEIRNAEFKTIPLADRSQILSFYWTPEWLEDMNKKYIPILDEMITLRTSLADRISDPAPVEIPLETND